jgi:hypothetical protein
MNPVVLYTGLPGGQPSKAPIQNAAYHFFKYRTEENKKTTNTNRKLLVSISFIRNSNLKNGKCFS